MLTSTCVNLGPILLTSPGTTKGDWTLALLVGLLILKLVGFIPYVGGLVRLDVLASVWERSLGSFTGLHER
jgi:uncharacterized membrane protein